MLARHRPRIHSDAADQRINNRHHVNTSTVTGHTEA